jgi:drug/metabolite transporter (DMT)-like permease
MMAGGAMLLAGSAALGEVPPLPGISPEAAAAIAYQIVAGSLIAFTSYEWLLTQVSATKVTSYAYVNPVVALVIGHELGGEPIGARTIVGCILVLASTIALLRRREPARSAAAPIPEVTGRAPS